MEVTRAAIVMRWRWRQMGGHVHVRVFTGPEGRAQATFAKNGDLVFSVDEWSDVIAQLSPRVEVLAED